MKTLGYEYFSGHCLEELDRLDDGGLVITRDGVPYAKVDLLEPVVVPSGGTDFSRLHGVLEGKIRIKGDIMSTGVEWDAARGVIDVAEAR